MRKLIDDEPTMLAIKGLVDVVTQTAASNLEECTSFQPYVVVQDGTGKRAMQQFIYGDGEEQQPMDRLVAMGRKYSRGFKGSELYALVYDGYVTDDDGRHDAIIVEAGIGEARESVVYCQLYTHDGGLRMLGETTCIGTRSRTSWWS